MLRVITWIDAASRANNSGGAGVGLCKADALDVDRIGRWLFDTYLFERAKGGTEIDARQRLLEVMRASSR